MKVTFRDSYSQLDLLSTPAAATSISKERRNMQTKNRGLIEIAKLHESANLNKGIFAHKGNEWEKEGIFNKLKTRNRLV